MNRIEWLTDTYLPVGDYKIPCASDLGDGYNQGSGIKPNSKRKLVSKRLLWPLWKLRCDLLIDGFIERNVGILIHKYIARDTVFLDIGCGDMSLRRFVPSDSWFNGLDLQLSEFHIMRVLRGKQNVNVVLASATEIPASSNSVSMIVSTETLGYISDIDTAIKEIHRIATPDATMICCIPNSYCHKYVRKGPHPQVIHGWTYEGFIEYMSRHHFAFVEGFMKGRWIPLPLWITKTSYQLPFSSRAEYRNTNFFYVFKVIK